MDQITIIEVAENPELTKCLEYLLKADSGLSKAEIADHFNISRGTLYNWLLNWERAGIMERASEIFLIPKAESIARAIDEVLNETPQMIRNMIKLSKGADSQRNQIDATEWLWQRIVQPRMLKRENPGAAEKDYITSEKLRRMTVRQGDSPLSISD